LFLRESLLERSDLAYSAFVHDDYFGCLTVLQSHPMMSAICGYGENRFEGVKADRRRVTSSLPGEREATDASSFVRSIAIRGTGSPIREGHWRVREDRAGE
jgi:hypothetical protein